MLFRSPKQISGNKKSEKRDLTTWEYDELIQNAVVQPQPEPGTYGIGFVYQGDGEWVICEKAPEPCSLSLVLAGGAVLMSRRRNS